MTARTWRSLLRAATTLVTLDLFAQAMFAGRFMAGSYDALDAHRVNAMLAAAGMLLAAVCFAAARRYAGVPAWWVVVAALLAVAAGAQIALGFRMALAAHIPLGVALVAGQLALTVQVWRAAANPIAMVAR
ncbi:hypothetical protein [Nocardia stercoris]|uniref:Uncharacterized protein n=1 Tax=Nocardia stercoris TaxID=2483361 RepID=A0A3M2KYS8_9NOCA|nr:hypothetical protein [Nocardia stercoris]RMI30637.1 hypothetical protein EBN03_21500 [Nocardia stercoris]